MNIPVILERSRSGNGAHAWFFFQQPIPATVSRKMGCYLLTETMSRRHQLSMSSYDRLFPNQDTMPTGRFGNLIALPLQKDARDKGNTMFLGIDLKQIGHISGGKDKTNSRLDVAMIQILVRKGVVKDIVANYGHVIVDECHHVPAVSFERVLAEIKAKYVTGLTATPQRRDGHHPISEMQLGPVRFSVNPKDQAASRPFDHKLIIRDTAFQIGLEGDPKIQELYALLASDSARNDLILNDVIVALEEGRSPILLTERRDHLDFFEEKLTKLTRNLIVLSGGMGAKQRREIAKRFSDIPDNEERLVLATGRYIGEGFDDARLDTLFLALPVSWKGTLIQYTGRLHRLYPGKTEVRIYDYVDRNVPMLARMFERRSAGYRAIGYSEIDEKSQKQKKTSHEEPIIELDEEVLRTLREE